MITGLYSFIFKFLKTFLAFVLILVASSCDQTSIDSNKVELEFWTLQMSNYKDYIQDLIKEYEISHPNIKIKWLDVPFKEGEKRALASALSNKVPDIINLNPSFSSTLASKKALVNFNDYLSPKQINLYLPASLQACSMGDFNFGVPWYITSSITIYNQDNLKKVGLKAAPKTYDELLKQARIIKHKLNQYAFIPTLTEGDYFLKILLKNNINIISKNKPYKALFNDNKAISLLQIWVNLYKEDIIPADSIVTNHQEAIDKFQSGVTTFIIIGPNFLKSIKDNSPELYKKINISPQVVGTSNKVDFSVMNFVIPIKSNHKKEAVDFIIFITNSKNQLAFSKMTPTLPSNLEALNDDFFKTCNDPSLENKARIISANQLKAGAESLPVLKNQQQLLEILNFYVQKAMLGNSSTKEALNNAAAKWNDLL